MKNIILTAIVAGASLFVATPKAEAGSCKPRVTYTCKQPVYKVKTVVVNKCRYKKAAYDNCGRKYYYWVTVTTYRDIYSNGKTRTWSRTA